jgi:hypothetical protein
MMTAFSVLVILPAMAFAFVVLSTFYGARRAYLAICRVPLALCAILTPARHAAHDASD